MQASNGVPGYSPDPAITGYSGVVTPDRPEEHTTGGPQITIECGRGVFQRLPTQLQSQPLLGIHRLRLTRRYPKERWIEFIDLVEVAAISMCIFVFVPAQLLSVHIPESPTRREVGDCIET